MNTTPATATLGDLLAALNYTPNEPAIITTRTDTQRGLTTTLWPPHQPIPLPQDRHVYYTPNPINPATLKHDPDNPGTYLTRGTADNVTRLAALWADFDLADPNSKKRGKGFTTYEAMYEATAFISNLIEMPPAIIVHSGNGIQPLWPLTPSPETHLATPENHTRATTLLAMWRALTAAAAEVHYATADAVYDLARILRCPGTLNHKTNPPHPATAFHPNPGAQITYTDIEQTLTANGFAPPPPQPLPPAQYVPCTEDGCVYAKAAIARWSTDQPTNSRHNWMLSKYTKLAIFDAYGCLTPALAAEGDRIIDTTFRHLMGNDRPHTRDNELRDGRKWGPIKAAKLSLPEIAHQLGNHQHNQPKRRTTPALAAAERTITTATAPAPAETPPAPAPTPHLHAVPNTPTTTTYTPPQNHGLGTYNTHTWEIHTPGGHTLIAGNITLDHLGAGHILAHHLQNNYLHIDETNKWKHWTGTHWADTPDKHIRHQTRQLFEGIQLTPSTPAHATKYLTKELRTPSHTKAAIDVATATPGITATITEFDTNPWHLNTPGGIINLQTGTTEPCTPNHRCTKITTTTPAPPETPHPQWDNFLTTTFNGNTDLINYIQALAGLMLIGQTLEHILALFYGEGANGKTVLLETLQHLMGSYAAPAKAGLLLGDAKEHDVNSIIGLRFVHDDELPEKAFMNSGFMKRLTGGDTIRTRYLYSNDYFDFKPCATIIIAGNHRPTITDDSYGMTRRLRLIPFTHQVPEPQRNPHLTAQLLNTEGPAILRWMINGATHYHQHGLETPDTVRVATTEYLNEENSFGTFLDERLERCPAQFSLTSRQILDAFDEWRAENGGKQLSLIEVGKRVGKHFGITAARTMHGRFYQGIRFVNVEEEPW